MRAEPPESGRARNRSGEGHPTRLAADSPDLAQGLGQLVVALLELVRDLLERQAIRRVEGGNLSADEIERLGQALLELEERFAELREKFDVEPGGLQLPFTTDDFLADLRRDSRGGQVEDDAVRKPGPAEPGPA